MDTSRFFRTALTAAVPFGLAMGTFNGFRYGLESGVGSGIGMGLAFGLCLAGFAEYQRKRLGVAGDMYEGQRIVHQGPANHRQNLEARGGWLILTETTLHFRSHGANVQNQPLTLPVEHIRAVLPRNSLGIIPNGLRFELDGDRAESFLVGGRGAWLSALQRVRPRTP